MKRKAIEIDLYEGLKLMRAAKAPFSVEHVETSIKKRTGGNRNWIEQVLVGPNRKHKFSTTTIGLENNTGEIRQIYIHSILHLEIEGKLYKLTLNF